MSSAVASPTDSGPVPKSPFLGTAAATYERMTSGTTRIVAKNLVNTASPITQTSVVLDNASGTGIVIEELLAHIATKEARPKIHAVDANPGMIHILQAKIAADPTFWQGVSAQVLPAEKLDFEDNTFTHSFTNFGILFFSDPPTAAKEIYRTLQPGGTALVTSWTDLGLEPWRAAEARIRPGQEPFEFPVSRNWLDPTTTLDVMREAGFTDVSSYEAVSARRDKDVETLLENQKMTLVLPLKHWSDDEKAQLMPVWKEELMKDEGHYFVDEETGEVGIRMVAHVVVCRK